MKERSIRKLIVASAIGTTIEWYDLFLFATASALVFNRIFFPTFEPLVGTLLAFGTFASAYFARIVGAMVFGHFGDRLGRKSMLMWSLGLMGVATFFIGLLPDFRSIGLAAPILLLGARLVQGFALGGEWGGAVLMAVEHAPPGKRGFYGSWVQVGVPLGTLIANIVFLICANAMSTEALLAWGWRIPFLLSAVLVYVGYLIRVNVDETPEFATIRIHAAQARLPFVDMLKFHWVEVILGALLTMSGGVAFNLIVTFGLAYGTQTLGFSRSMMLTFAMAACALCTLLVPVFGRIGDAIGHRRVLAFGIVAEGLFAFPMFWLMDVKSIPFTLVGFLTMAVAFAANYAPNATYLAGLFKANVRYSGLSVTYMLAGLISSAASPFVTTALLNATGKSSSVAWYMIICSTASVTALMLLKGPLDRDSPRRLEETAI
ncbi:MHS family MFS transporter [Burkholderia aenigmatica]|uniref:MFS transporter n=1 Tax=Burkholderia cepacia complex TaxID=87882 RepID=UPI001C219D83|nr:MULTISPECIES: MFS transporter [Burkholderia cepacia complex]MBU9445237.1 MHS family MFS transporter [Burkholderia multivorans]MCA8222091.1 MHS family MFS transporter [Burkholderia multivorans]UKD17545.1 MHS family MFS transporter [Burkholderia aenigmatica]